MTDTNGGRFENINLATLIGPAFASFLLVALVKLVANLPEQVVPVQTKGLMVSVALAAFVFSVFVWPALVGLYWLFWN